MDTKHHSTDKLIKNAFSLLSEQKFTQARKILMSLEKGCADNYLVPYGLAVIAHQQQDLHKAEDLYLRSIHLNSNYPGSLYHLANLYKTKGNIAKAEIYYKKALLIKPDFFECLNNLANLYKENHQDAQAQQYYKSALSLKVHPVVCFNLGHLYQQRMQWDQAEHYFKKALQLRPDYFECINNLASLYLSQEKYDLSEQYYQKALALNANAFECHYNLGNLYKLAGRFKDAETHYKIAMELAPDYKPSYLNYALLKLLLGHYKTGFQYYEHRPAVRDFAKSYKLSSVLWSPSHRLKGKSILVIGEQGFGDSIYFSRFTKVLKDRGCQKVVFCCNPVLHSLLLTNPYIDEVTASVNSVTTDFHILAGSLMQYINWEDDQWVSSTPYLYADARKIKALAKYFDSEKPKVGINFTGNPKHRNDQNRSRL
ncbi:tetratricopeptide repeat protein [Facilibium subflavum]|uniref:tetratricopeptide repeat protein n=1 Tax=Facilibium subflavum TaxID=2219058 RepID=UPI000E64BCA3|nr:tetratricopeptide repeat protein [Facilibium subflavum]